MQTIPDDLLDRMLARWPHLGAGIAAIRAHPERAAQGERALATNCLHAEISWLSAREAFDLASCAGGEPFGARRVWIDTDEAARLTGYDRSHIRRLTYTGRLAGENRQGLWVRREDIEHLPPRSNAGRPRKETADA